MMIQNYVDAMMQGDYKALSECFSEKCSYFDYTLSTWNMHNYHVYEKNLLRCFSATSLLSASQGQRRSGRKREYRKSSLSMLYSLFVRATIEEYGKDGKIQNMRVRLG